MPTFIETLRVYWQKRLVRVFVALLVLAGAIYLQYRLANIPVLVDVEKSKPPYTPATALVLREELVVDTPTVDNSTGQTSAGLLFSGEGTDYVSVEARFDSAQIGKDFIELLQTDPEQKSFPTLDRQAIVYSAMPTEEAAVSARDTRPQPMKQRAAPCRTSIAVKLPEGAKPLTELHFFQLQPGSDHDRRFEMKAVGADVVVELVTSNLTDDFGEMQGTDCGKTLSIGQWNRSFTAPAPIRIVVPAGSAFRFSFTSAEGKMPWTGPGKFYEPFRLVALPLNARAVREVQLEAPAAILPATPTSPFSSPTPIRESRSVDGEPPLLLKYFRVGPEELQLDFAGRAMVQENGQYVMTFDLLEFIRRNMILAGILAMLNAALLEWIRRTLFKGNKSSD